MQEDSETGPYLHIVKRGTRGLPIVRDESDRFRFLLMLTHFNDHFSSLNWYRDLQDEGLQNSLERPLRWPERKPLVEIAAFALVENHFHLLLRGLVERGVSRFMQRIGIGMAKRYNERYRESGSLFQSGYRSKVVDEDGYFRYVSTYIQIKNAFDAHPKGYLSAHDHFDEAYDWARSYPYASLSDYDGVFERPIIDRTFLSSLYTPDEYREFARDVILGRHPIDEEIQAHHSGLFE